MARTAPFAAFFSGVLLISHCPLWAAPTTQPNVVPDAAALVREVWKGEEWIDHAKSLDVRLTDLWTRDGKSIDARREELKRRFPDMQINEQTFPELRPLTTGTVELAFDEHRLYKRTESPDGTRRLDVRVWDGHRAVTHGVERHREFFAFESKPTDSIGRIFLNEIVWPWAGPHHYWWLDRQYNDAERDFRGLPEDYRISGIEDYRGHACYGVQTDWYWRTLLVGIKDGHVYGIKDSMLPSDPKVSRQWEAANLQMGKEHGQSFSTSSQFDAWYAALPESERRKIQMQQFHHIAPFTVRFKENWYDDYHEISPGCLMPMTIGYRIWDINRTGVLLADRELRVVSAVVNQPLPEDFFQPMQIPEGAQINDWTHDPPLVYKYKQHMTSAEWDEILRKAEQNKELLALREAAGDAMLGRPAPPFPEAAVQWLNSKPLKWSDLKGKVVILDFWAEWCGPCRNDLPQAVKIHEDSAQSGIVIIGVHPPGSEMLAIQKVMKQFEMHYPVCIDSQPPEGSKAWGLLYDRFGVMGIPDSILVDTAGKVVGHGSLAQMLAQARRLAAK